MEYPTRNGISIPSSELDLPETRLDLSQGFTENTHHLEFTRRSMGRLLITQTLRDLSGLQEIQPLDVHAYLHKAYEPPKFPTLRQAMGRLMIARDTGEKLRIKADVGYEEDDITDDLWKRLNSEYHSLK